VRGEIVAISRAPKSKRREGIDGESARVRMRAGIFQSRPPSLVSGVERRQRIADCEKHHALGPIIYDIGKTLSMSIKANWWPISSGPQSAEAVPKAQASPCLMAPTPKKSKISLTMGHDRRVACRFTPGADERA